MIMIEKLLGAWITGLTKKNARACLKKQRIAFMVGPCCLGSTTAERYAEMNSNDQI